MSDGGLTVLDGSHVRALDLSLPESDGIFTGAQLLQTAESRASSSLFGLSLPDYLKISAIKRLKIGDLVGFRRSELDRDEAASILRDYVSAIADELKEDPLVVAVLDGKTLRLFLEDEDDFAMLAENLFTDLDTEDKGKINKNEITNALVHMGVELGIPPFSEFPQLHNMIEKHGADKEEQLGQAQFAELLQQVLQELADALAKNHLVVIQKIKLVNGSKIRNILASGDKMKAITEKMLQKKNDSVKDLQTTDIVRDFLEENEKDLGLPSSKSHESVALLYDEVCTDAGNINKVPQSKDEIHLLVENILEKLSEKLEANPVFQDLDD